MNLEEKLAQKRLKLEQLKEKGFITKVKNIFTPLVFDVSNSIGQLNKTFMERFSRQGELVLEVKEKIEAYNNEKVLDSLQEIGVTLNDKLDTTTESINKKIEAVQKQKENTEKQQEILDDLKVIHKVIHNVDNKALTKKLQQIGDKIEQLDSSAVLQEVKDLSEIIKKKDFRGEKGEQGVAGRTPVKGEDYYTKQDVEGLIKDILEKLPKHIKQGGARQYSSGDFNFIGLNDVVTKSYSGKAGKGLVVNEAETGLEFTSIDIGDITSITAGTNLNGGGSSGDVTINLNSALTAINSLGFNTAYSKTGSEVAGTIYWDDQYKTWSAVTSISGVVGQLFEEQWLDYTNKTGATITNGQVLYINGAQGSQTTMDLAIANDAAKAHATIAIATHDVANNAQGKATKSGTVRDLDTSAWAEGTKLYLSESVAGGITSTAPTKNGTNHIIEIGTVKRQHATQGEVEVNIRTHWDLDELDTVTITSVADNDLLQYNSGTGLWENTAYSTFVSGIDHGELDATSLLDDDHTQYALLAGRSGGQTLYGGTAAGNGLTLYSTSNATKGTINLAGLMYIDEANSRVGLGGTATSAVLHFLKNVTNDYYINFTGTASPTTTWQAIRAVPFIEPGASLVGQVLYSINNNMVIQGSSSYGIDSVIANFAKVTFQGSYTGAITEVVGIRSSSPVKLESANPTVTTYYGVDVNNSTIATTNYGVRIQQASGSTNWGVYASGTAQNFFRGYIGVGATGVAETPSAPIHAVVGNGTLPTMTTGTAIIAQRNAAASNRTFIAVIAGDTSTQLGINFGNSTDDDKGYIRYDNTNNDLTLGANTATALFLDSTGRVTVGTTDGGTAKFQVTGSSDQVQEIIKANSTQTSNIFEIQNSSGTAKIFVEPSFATEIAATPTTDASKGALESYMYLSQGATNLSSNYYALYASTETNAAQSGTVTTAIGLKGVVNHYGTGTMSNAYGLQFQINARSTGNITNARGIYIQSPTEFSTGAITNAYGLDIQTMTDATNSYGINIGNITASSSAYAIKTGTGLNSFGDKVGIGVTTPSYQLDVASEIVNATATHRNYQNVLTINNSTTNAFNHYSQQNQTTIKSTNVGNLTGTITGLYNIVRVQDSGNTHTHIAPTYTWGDVTGGSTVTAFTTVYVDRMTVSGGSTITNANGVFIENVNVGTNNSQLILGLSAVSSIPTGNWGIYNASTYDNYFAGNIGIGVTSPAQKVHIDGHILLENGWGVKQEDSGGIERNLLQLDSSNNLYIGASTGPIATYIRTAASTPIIFSLGGAEKARIHTNGYLGVNTNSPVTYLDVNGGAAFAVETITASSDTLDTSNYIVLGNCTSNNITINLPAISGVNGTVYIIKKIDSTTNTVTIDANGSETIDGSTTAIITDQYAGVQIVAGSSEWHVIAIFA